MWQFTRIRKPRACERSDGRDVDGHLRYVTVPTHGETIHHQHILPALDGQVQVETSATYNPHNAGDRVDTPQVSDQSKHPPTSQNDIHSVEGGPLDNSNESGEGEVDDEDECYVRSPATCLPDDDPDGFAFIPSGSTSAG